VKLERIEELLRSQPPGEPDYRGELRLDAHATGAARSPVRWRGPFAAALYTATVIAVVVGAVFVGLVIGQLAAKPTVGPSASIPPGETPQASLPLGVIPWIDATPAPSPTQEPTPDPMSLPECTADELALAAGGWGGATGSLAGGAVVINVSPNPCRVGGKPALALFAKKGDAIARSVAAESGMGADAVVLPPGGVAGVIIVWSNWCGDPPTLPLFLRLTLHDGRGELSATIRAMGPGLLDAVPRCDAPGGVSTIGVPLPFSAPEPSMGGYQPQACAADELAAYSGDWGPALGTFYTTLVVLNVGGFDCLLETAPALELRDANGGLLPVAQSESPPVSASTLMLPSGWAAVTRLAFADWCSTPPALPLQLDLVIGSSRVKVESRADVPVPACMSAPQSPPPTFAYDVPLAVPGGPVAPEPNPIDTLPVSVVLSPLPTTAPGANLEYTVTLTNISAYDKPLNLATECPDYTARLFLPNALAAIDTHLVLNCQAAGWLEAHASVTFAMRLPIPADAQAGTATLVWLLGERGAGMKATFQVGP
jgi:hypothetical protein